MTSAPPVTDTLPIAIRAYAVSAAPPSANVKKPQSSKRKARPVGASAWTLVFDTETTTGASQALRFGTYQVRQAGELREAGILFDPEGVSDDELAVLRHHADAHGLTLRTRDEFADEVFFAIAWQLRATIVGFNLPFDIARLAIAHGTARTPLSGGANAMHGGFTFKLSHQKIYPNIRVKHMSRKAALISFAAPMGQRDGRGARNRGMRKGVRRGHFIDVKTLGGAIFAKSFSLASLSHHLGIPNPKIDFDDFDGPITDAMVEYAVRDVQATWECYAALIERFEALKLTKSIPEKIYSEASIGKAYLKEMGIAPWRTLQPDVPPDVIAKIMGSYFGGRSEVRIRKEVREVILCDFLSMYPTVCTLMGLWNFVVAKDMSWRDATDEARQLLDCVDLAELQSPAFWPKLTMLVRVLPDADIFPVRASYLGEAQSTIGANYLTADSALWFTLADCIASKLLTGKAPHIVEALAFTPGPIQGELQPIDVAGNPEYQVDPNTTDFFKRVIELRQATKRREAQADGEEKARLGIEQHALKICANSTSYGIWVEVNVETKTGRRPVTVHSSIAEPFEFSTDKTEMPGRYFHPLLATLITGAARLMLAIAERLSSDQGLDWAFCDTDSMAFARPEHIDGDDFARRTRAIVDWFAALNPYDFGGSILKVEDVNGSLDTGEPQPLYCYAISSKRYALFNLASDGSPIMRKVSAHGLGHLRPPYSANNPPPGFPEPHESVLRDGTERWHCDLWHRIVSAALAGHPDQVALDFHSALNTPAVSRYAATSPDMLAWFKTYNASRPYRDQVKPFGFLLSLGAALNWDCENHIGPVRRGRPKKVAPIKPTAPFDSDHAKAVAMAFDRETGMPVEPSRLRSYAEALARYHISPESKFLNGDYVDRGTTQRRHVRMAIALHIGKEAHDWERQAMIGRDADSEIAYGVAGAPLAERLREYIAEFGEGPVATALGVSKVRLQALVTGTHISGMAKLAKSIAAVLPDAINRCAKFQADQNAELESLRQAVERDGLRETVRRFGIDPSNLRKQLARRD